MANSNRPNGMRPYEVALRERPYVAGATVYPGDAVKVQSDGTVVAASASDALAGAAASYGTSGSTISVWDDPNQLFVIQADSDGSVSVAQSDVGLNYDIVATAGDTTYKQSRMELDASSGATTPATLPLRLLGLMPAVNEDAGVNAKCVVSINSHQLRAGTAGV